MDVTIPLFRISQPPDSLFKVQVKTLLKECKARHGLVNKDQRSVLYKRQKLCNLMLDALYQAYCMLRLLILTGARKREVLDAKWQDFDFLRRIWRIPTPKTGKARHVPLSDGVISLLSAMPKEKGCDWAFANPNTGKPYVSIFWAWDAARNKADLADVRVHDLRHSTASFLVNAGRTLYEVQHILGHTQVKTTQRYAHLSHDTLLDATNSVNTALGGMFVPMVSASPAAQVQLVQ